MTFGLVGGFNPLKNISQWEGLSHIFWKIKNIWNHQPVGYFKAKSSGGTLSQTQPTNMSQTRQNNTPKWSRKRLHLSGARLVSSRIQHTMPTVCVCLCMLVCIGYVLEYAIPCYMVFQEQLKNHIPPLNGYIPQYMYIYLGNLEPWNL